jgi:hypothetical protein
MQTSPMLKKRVVSLALRAAKSEEQTSSLEARFETLLKEFASCKKDLKWYKRGFATMSTAIASYEEQINSLKRQICLLSDVNKALNVPCPEDAATVARTLDTLGLAHNSNKGQFQDIREELDTLRARLELQQAVMKKIENDDNNAVKQLATFKDALLKTTSARTADAALVAQTGTPQIGMPTDLAHMLVVRAPPGTTRDQVSAAMALCLHCAPADIVKVHLATNQTPPNRDPRLQQDSAPMATAATSNASNMPPRRWLFVVTLATSQLVDMALKSRQCRELLKGSHDLQVDDYLTREQLQQRKTMRPAQERLQQQGVVAAWRGVELWKLVAPEGSATLGEDKIWCKVGRTAGETIVAV